MTELTAPGGDEPGASGLTLHQPTLIRFVRRDRYGRNVPLRGPALADAADQVLRDAPRASAPSLIAGWLLEQTSDNTRSAYAADLERWSEFLHSRDLALTEATRADAAAWKRQLARTGAANATVNRRLAAMSSLYRYLAQTGHDHLPNPFDAIKRSPARTDHRWLTVDQTRQLLAAAAARSPRDLLLVNLLYAAALRVSEVCTANIDDVHTTATHQLLHIVGKGDKPDRIPLTGMARHALDAWRPARQQLLTDTRQRRGPDGTPAAIIADARQRRADADAGRLATWNDAGITDRWDDANRALLLCDSGWRLTRQTAHAYVRRCATDAGLDDVSPHVLRASLITHLAEAGVPQHKVQHVARHSRSETTAGYIRATTDLDDHPLYLLDELFTDDT